MISTFDTPGSITVSGLGTWGLNGEPVPDSLLQRNATEGVSCPGALQLTIPFTTYGQNTDTEINFNPLQNWTGGRKVHAQVKVLMPSTGNLNHINGIQLAANSTTNYNTYQGHFYSAATFMDFGWHALDLDIPGTTTATSTAMVLSQVIQVQVQVLSQSMAPASGPAAPVSTTILIDDVWVE